MSDNRAETKARKQAWLAQFLPTYLTHRARSSWINWLSGENVSRRDREWVDQADRLAKTMKLEAEARADLPPGTLPRYLGEAVYQVATVEVEGSQDPLSFLTTPPFRDNLLQYGLTTSRMEATGIDEIDWKRLALIQTLSLLRIHATKVGILEGDDEEDEGKLGLPLLRFEFYEEVMGAWRQHEMSRPLTKRHILSSRALHEGVVKYVEANRESDGARWVIEKLRLGPGSHYRTLENDVATAKKILNLR